MSVDPLNLFKALADPIRLRIVRAVGIAELSVAELVSVLGLPQSTVSRHLKPLRDSGLLETRRDGTSVFYRRGPAFGDQGVSGLLDGQLESFELAREDAASVRRVVDQRKQHSREFFDKIAGSYGSLTEPGGGWQALAAGLAAGFYNKDVADIGSGEGHLTMLLAPFARKVTAVDLSPQMLRQVHIAAEEQGLLDKVAVAEGDIEALPLPDAAFDACVLSQALHHAAQPEKALAEAARILRPEGQLLIFDLVSHTHEWVRDQWADQWLGFDFEALVTMLTDCGLEVIYQRRIEGSAPDLPVLIMIARKPK